MGVGPGSVLIDGFGRATWRITRERDAAILSIGPVVPLMAHERREVEVEGAALLRFAAPDATDHDVRVATPQ